jgi:hypothetical protein
MAARTENKSMCFLVMMTCRGLSNYELPKYSLQSCLIDCTRVLLTCLLEVANRGRVSPGRLVREIHITRWRMGLNVVMNVHLTLLR